MSTVLQLNFESDFTDTSASAHTVTVNSGTINTTAPLFGVGSGDIVNLSIAVNSDFNFGYVGAGNWTVRFCAVGNANVNISVGNGSIIIANNNDFASPRARIQYDPTVERVNLLFSEQTSYAEYSLEQYNDVYRLYINGTQVASGSAVTGNIYTGTGSISITSTGLIDSFLIDKGTALAGGASSYTASNPNTKFVYTTALTQDGTLTPASIVQTHTISTTPLTQNGTLPAMVRPYIVSTTPLTQNNELVPASVHIAQTIGTTALTQNGTLTPAVIVQTHIISTTPLTQDNTLNSAVIVAPVVIRTTPLTQSNTLDSASFLQTHVIRAYPLNSDNWLDIDNKKFLALVFSPENGSTATWSNLNFTGSHQFKGKTLFVSSTGLFEYGGSTDNGTTVKPSLKTGKLTEVETQAGIMPSYRLKRIPESVINVYAKKNGRIDLTINEDGTDYTYSDTLTDNRLTNYRVRIGRGIEYNEMTLYIVSNGATTLDIDKIGYTPVEMRRTR